MRRTQAIAVLLLGVAALGVTVARRWPRAHPRLDCPPSEVRLDPHGVARCGPGGALPAGQALTVGEKVDLNQVSDDELTLLPGISEELAQAIVERRDALGGFRDWGEVDAIHGVGTARLGTLQEYCDIRAPDAGL